VRGLSKNQLRHPAGELLAAPGGHVDMVVRGPPRAVFIGKPPSRWGCRKTPSSVCGVLRSWRAADQRIKTRWSRKSRIAISNEDRAAARELLKIRAC
jgi:hypothetical protein